MKEKLFIGILNMSLTACIIIPVVIALRFLLRKAPKLFSYILWSVVLFRLICPVSFPAAFSLLGVLDAPKTERGQISYISVDTAVIPADTKDVQLPVANPVQGGTASEKTPAAEPMVSAVTIGSWIWIAGILALLIYSVATLVKLKRKLKGAKHERDNIYIAENLTTPFVCGFLAPKIYLPAALAGEEKAYILLHEQIHIRRGDHIVKLLGYLALCLHWFNPLVWAAFFLSGRDMEMSCDEAVIRKMGVGVKKEYSASLLNLATGRRIIGGVPLAFGEGDTGGRIKNVLGYKKPAAALICAAVIVIAAAAAVLLANPRKISASEGAGLTGGVKQTGKEAPYGAGGEYGAAGQENEADNAGQEDAEAGASLQEEPESGTLEIRMLSEKEPKTITAYALQKDDGEWIVYNGWEDGIGPLVFAADCVYKVNTSMETIDYEEVSYEEFMDFLETEDFRFSIRIAFVDNVIVEAAKISIYEEYGISYAAKISYGSAYQYLLEVAGEDMLEQYYTLAGTETFDVADSDGDEQIEVYTGDIGEGESGLVLFRNADGSLLYSELVYDNHLNSRDNVYLGEIDGTGFIMDMHIYDDALFGVDYSYHVYRLSAEGEILQIAGSGFAWGPYWEYQDELFKEWVEPLTYYLEHSHLILSHQVGELRTEQVSEADKYNYETLNLKDRSLERMQ
ncbi:MAG: hypothetical protein HDR08_03215 [Lachnospiraceae bacterium]|nr:hypothetical protein [Lachnospiraceae bacterium]